MSHGATYKGSSRKFVKRDANRLIRKTAGEIKHPKKISINKLIDPYNDGFHAYSGESHHTKPRYKDHGKESIRYEGI